MEVAACVAALLPVNPQRPPSRRHSPSALSLSSTTLHPLSSRRHSPRFPGSISTVHPPPADFRRAIELHRSLAAEILLASLRAGRLSITYATNLLSVLPAFLDRIVIAAAELKGDDEFAHLSFNARAKMFILTSGIVPLVKWLKHHTLTYPQIGKVISMCSDNLEAVRRAVEWLKSVGVKGELLGRVLLRGSAVLRRNIDDLDDIVGYIERCGVRRNWIGFIIGRCPQILELSMVELQERVRFYMDMGMSENDFGTMVFDCPRALGYLSLEEMNSKVSYLKEFGLSSQDVGGALAHTPQLMLCSIEEKWKPLVKYLYYLNVSREGMKRMLLLQPVIFCLDLEKTVAPKVRFLQDLGVRDDAIGGILMKFPPILTCSLYKKMRPVAIFLLTRAGVTKTDIGKVVALDPQILSCSITKKLEINVNYFLSLGIRQQLLGEMIADFPMLLRYKHEMFRPKYQYLRRVMVRPLQDVIEYPRFFSYSLEERIIPRHKIMVANRVNFKLRYMLSDTDEKFNQRVQEAVERRKRFEAGGDQYSGQQETTPSEEYTET